MFFFFFHMKIHKSIVVEYWSAFTVLSLLLKRERENAIKVMLCACRQYSQIMRFFSAAKLSSHGDPSVNRDNRD